jgi:hypothetical protein
MMKRITRFYPAILVALNILLAQGLRFASGAMSMAYRGVYPPGRKTFAPITMWAIQFHWWPYIVAGIFALACFLSLRGRMSDACILHASLGILVLEGFILFMTLVAFVVPFISFP